MADNFGVYDITGKLETTVSSSLDVALEPVSGNINIRRFPQRDLYNKILLGTAPAGSGDIPSWTQVEAEKKHAFVIGELSSSIHEVGSRNAYVSGTNQLEFTDVAASGTMFYSKGSRFQKLIYKLSASANLPLTPALTRNPSTIENASRATFNSVSGSYRNNSYFDPATFTIEIPDYGRIRDVKVWVELVHDHRGGTGTTVSGSDPFWVDGIGTGSSDLRQGLQGLQIALKSPNTDFKFSHPMWNDPTVDTFEKRPESTLPARIRGVPDLLRGSYLLWAGHSVESDLGITLSNHTSSLPHPWYSTVMITGSGDGPYYPSMQVDANDQPVTVWDQPFESKYKIRRSYFSGATLLFAKETVYSSTNVAGSTLLLAKDRRTPHILINENGGTLIKYARSSSLGWIIDNVTSTTSGLNSDIALDSNDKPMIVSRGTDNTPSIYLSSSVAGWEQNKIGKNWGSTGGTYYNSIAIRCDSQDRFHIAYPDTDEEGNWIFYARTGSDGLTIERTSLLDYTAHFGITLSIVVDKNDIPTILVGATFDVAGIKEIKSGSNGWSTNTLFRDYFTAGADVEAKGAMYDPDGNLNALVLSPFYRTTTGLFNQAVMRSGSNGWSFEFLPDLSVAETISFPQRSMDFSSVGKAHLLYKKISTGELIYLTASFTDGRSGAYYEYDTDIDMRTVFSDSSKVRNPRSMYDSYDSATSITPGPANLQIDRARITDSYPSPLSSSVSLFGYNYLDTPFFQSCWLTGANFPWMLDPRIPPGNFKGRNFSATASLGIPVPTGWLTGPGGTAAVNEFPTTGSQIGPKDIRPVYPLLDDIFVERVVPQTSSTGTPSALNDTGRKVVGFRPGLRGTEVHGKWQLLIGNTADAITGNMTGSVRGGYWFRQFRLEFLVDKQRDISPMYSSFSRKYSKPYYVPQQSGKRIIDIISGSSAWDIGTNRTYVVQTEEYGRATGITDDTSVTKFAVFSQLTGAFATALSSSGKLEGVQDTFLGNEFGTPFIPISSGSGETPTFDAYTAQDVVDNRLIFQQVLNPKTLVPGDNTLRALLSRSNVLISSRDLILSKTKK